MELGSYYRVLEYRGDTAFEVSRHRSLEEARRRFRARGRGADWKIEDPAGCEIIASSVETQSLYGH